MRPQEAPAPHHLVPQQLLADAATWRPPEQLAEAGQGVGLQADHPVEAGGRQHLDDGVHLHLHLGAGGQQRVQTWTLHTWRQDIFDLTSSKERDSPTWPNPK